MRTPSEARLHYLAVANFPHVSSYPLASTETFASGCVVVGRCPAELADLFGYNPVVEIEPGGELQQIVSILRNIEDYRPLVEQNYRRLLETATWEPRIDTVLHHAQRLIAPRPAAARTGAP